MDIVAEVFKLLLPYAPIALGMYLLGYSLLKKSVKSKLIKTGIKTEGIIFEQEYTHSPDNIRMKDEIRVRFVTQNQLWITELIKQDFAVFYTNQYKNGEKVTVYNEESNPLNFYVTSKQSELAIRITGALTGLGLCVIGLYLMLAL